MNICVLTNFCRDFNFNFSLSFPLLIYWELFLSYFYMHYTAMRLTLYIWMIKKRIVKRLIQCQNLNTFFIVFSSLFTVQCRRFMRKYAFLLDNPLWNQISIASGWKFNQWHLDMSRKLKINHVRLMDKRNPALQKFELLMQCCFVHIVISLFFIMADILRIYGSFITKVP